MKQNTSFRVCLAGNGWGAVSALKGLLSEYKNIQVVSNDEDVVMLAQKNGFRVTNNLYEVNADLFVCAGYTEIIKERFVSSNKILNIHYSLLPKYRGLHSTVWAILNGDDKLGLSVHLMTHLEKKRVEHLMDNGSTLKAAKEKVQGEILKIFNIDNVTLGNSESLDISKAGTGNAVLLAISTILQSDKTEAQLTELLSKINTDIRTDGTLDSTNIKATLVSSMEYLKPRRATIRSNIESRYNSLGISATIPAFESYIFKLDTTAPTVSSTSPSNGAITSISNLSVTFSDIIDNSTLTTSTITLVDNSSNTVSGTVSSSDNTTATIVTFTPISMTGGSYTATVSNVVKDLAGNSLAQNYSWSFEINWVGTKQLGTSSNDYAYGVATDSSGNVYVTGYTGGGLDGNTSAGSNDLFVVKYNSNGTKQ